MRLMRQWWGQRLALTTLLAALAYGCPCGAKEAKPPEATPQTKPADSAGPAGAALPVLRDNCFGCHNPEKKKGGLLLTSREGALRGNDNGPALVPGRSADSPLLRVLAADADPHMPPKKQLAAEEVATIRAWVDARAPWDEGALAARPGAGATGAATQPVILHELPAAYHPVLALALSPDEKRLAVGRGRRVFVHDLTRPDRPVTEILDGPRDAVQSLAWSGDGALLAAGDYGRVSVWDARAFSKPPMELAGLNGRVTAVLFLPADGSHDGASAPSLLAADGQPGTAGRLCLFRLPATQPAATVAAHGDTVLALAHTHDGSLVASAGADKLVKLWSNPGPKDELKEMARLEGHSGHVLTLAFKPDDTLLASAGGDRDVKIWDVKAREQKATIGPDPGAVTALVWPREGGRILLADEAGAVRQATDAESAPARATGAAAPDVLYALTATADGKHFYGGCHDGRVYVWDAAGKLEATLDEATGERK